MTAPAVFATFRKINWCWRDSIIVASGFLQILDKASRDTRKFQRVTQAACRVVCREKTTRKIGSNGGRIQTNPGSKQAHYPDDLAVRVSRCG